MGYASDTSTGSTATFKLHWTDKGREYLSRINPDKDGLRVKFFSLGDSDVNYNMLNFVIDDFIPSIGGISTVDCIIGTKQNEIKHELETGIAEIPVTITTDSNAGSITVSDIGSNQKTYTFDIFLDGLYIDGDSDGGGVGSGTTFSGLAPGDYVLRVAEINDAGEEIIFVTYDIILL